MLQLPVLQQLDNFFTQFKPLNFKRRDIVICADEPSLNVYFIKKGYARVYRISEDGEELTLTILKRGDFFPIFWNVANIPNVYYLEALTPLEICRVPHQQFIRFVRSQPEIFYELTNLALDRVGGLLNRMEYLLTSRAYTKVALTLLACAKRFGEQKGSDVIVNLPLTHKDIATLVGITRETTCLEMKKLENKGVISHQGRLIVIKDIKALEEESEVDNGTELMLYNSL